MIKIVKSGIYELPGLGAAHVVYPTAQVVQQLPPQIDERYLSVLLGMKLPKHPPLEFVPATDMDPHGQYVNEKGEPIKSSYTLVAKDRSDLQVLMAELFDAISRGVSKAEIDELEKETKGLFLRMSKPEIETFQYGWIRNTESGKFQYDLVRHMNGSQTVLVKKLGGGIEAIPLAKAGDRKGTLWGTPGNISVPVVMLNDLWHAALFLQFRPLMIEPESGLVKGQWVLGPAGGFGKAGISAKDQVAQELESETGVVKFRDFQVLGYNFADRAMFSVPVRNSLVTLEMFGDHVIERDANEEKYGINKVRILFPLELWRPGPDMVVNCAMDAACKALHIYPRYR